MPNYKFIFVITTGRSGSNYLADLLNGTKECNGFHEAHPVMNGKMMFDYLHGRKSELKSKMPEKILSIKNRITSPVYAETNHCFIKGFGWELFDSLDQKEVCVIVLKREKKEMIESTIKNNISPLSIVGRNWIITPSSTEVSQSFFEVSGTSFTNFKLMKFSYRFLYWMDKYLGLKFEKPLFISKYEKLALSWYYDETYNLADIFFKKFPNVQRLDLDLKDLNRKDKTDKLLKTLGLTLSKDAELKIGVPRNSTSNRINDLT